MSGLKKKERLSAQFSSWMDIEEISHRVEDIMDETGASYSDVMRDLIRRGLDDYERKE